MVQVIDVLLPILTLVIAALLTIPVFRLIRKSSNQTALTVGWFVAVFAVSGCHRSQPRFKLLQRLLARHP